MQMFEDEDYDKENIIPTSTKSLNKAMFPQAQLRERKPLSDITPHYRVIESVVVCSDLMPGDAASAGAGGPTPTAVRMNDENADVVARSKAIGSVRMDEERFNWSRTTNNISVGWGNRL